MASPAMNGVRNPYQDLAVRVLKDANVRITGARMEVVRALATSEVALSPYDIHRAVVRAGGTIDQVSVYRVLDALIAADLVYKVGLLNKYVKRMERTHLRARTLFVNVHRGTVLEMKPDPAVLDLVKGRAFQLEIEVEA